MSLRDKIKITLILLLLAVLFVPIYRELVYDWLSHSDNSHGFLVPVIAGYFVWQRKKQLRSASIISSGWGCVLLLLSLSLYIVSYAGNAVFPSRVAFVMSLLGLLWCCLGSEIIRLLAFPILFMLFMIPIPYSLMNYVSVPLQLWATRISAYFIEVCFIPVYREGNMLYFVNAHLEVAEGCSGIRSIMSLLMIAVVFASIIKDCWFKRTIVVISAIPIALIANILRITGTGIMAHFFGDKVARGFLHEFSGIVIFVFGFIALLGVYIFINKKPSAHVK